LSCHAVLSTPHCPVLAASAVLSLSWISDVLGSCRPVCREHPHACPAVCSNERPDTCKPMIVAVDPILRQKRTRVCNCRPRSVFAPELADRRPSQSVLPACRLHRSHCRIDAVRLRRHASGAGKSPYSRCRVCCAPRSKKYLLFQDAVKRVREEDVFGEVCLLLASS
jgi:hypothetical protein